MLIKTLAKPVSKRIKHEFSRYAATQRLLYAIGQTSHQVTSRLTIWSAGYKVRSIPDLPEDKAVQIGSEFVGESFILVVSAATVLYEYNRSKEKEEAKAEQKRTEEAAKRRELQLQLHALDVRLQALEQVVESNSQSIFAYLQSGVGKKQYKPPNANELVPITLDSSEQDSEPLKKDTGVNSAEESKRNEGVTEMRATESTEQPSIKTTTSVGPWWNWRPW